MNNKTIAQSSDRNNQQTERSVGEKRGEAKRKGRSSSGSFAIIPHEDLLMLWDEPDSVKKLFLISWVSNPFSSKPVELKLDLVGGLPQSSFKRARKALSSAGLFSYRPIPDPANHKKTKGWAVSNFHGIKNRTHKYLQTDSEIEGHTRPSISCSEGHTRTHEGHTRPSIESETFTQQEFQKPSRSFLNSTTYYLRQEDRSKVKNEDGDRVPKLALNEQLSSATPTSEENKDRSESSNTSVEAELNSCQNPNMDNEDFKVLTKESTRNYAEMGVHELAELDIEGMSLEELQKLPTFESRGVDVSGKMKKAVRKQRIADYLLRSEYTSRIHQTISLRLDAEKRAQKENPSKSPLTAYREQINAKVKAKKIADREKRLRGQIE